MVNCFISCVRMLGAKIEHKHTATLKPIYCKAKDFFDNFSDGAELIIRPCQLPTTISDYNNHENDILIEFNSRATKDISDILDNPKGWSLFKYYLIITGFGYIQSVGGYQVNGEIPIDVVCSSAEKYYDSLLRKDVFLYNLMTKLQRIHLLTESNLGFLLGMPSFFSGSQNYSSSDTMLFSIHVFALKFPEKYTNRTTTIQNRNMKVFAGYYLFCWEYSEGKEEIDFRLIMDLVGLSSASFVFSVRGTNCFLAMNDYINQCTKTNNLKQIKQIISHNNTCLLTIESAIRCLSEEDIEYIRKTKSADYFKEEYNLYRYATNDLLATIQGLEASRIQTVANRIQAIIIILTALAAFSAIKDIFDF